MRQLLIFLMTVSLFGGYKEPSKRIKKIFDAPPINYMKPIKGSSKVLQYNFLRMPSLERLSREYLSLGGEEIDPVFNTKKENYPYTKLYIRDLDSDEKFDISDEDDRYIYSYKISPDNEKIAYLTEADKGLILKVKQLEDGEEIYRSDFYVNNVFKYLSYSWIDSEKIVVAKVPEDRGERPVKKVKDFAPVIKESNGKVSKVRTYQNLLKDDFDILLFDYYFTSQVSILDIFTGEDHDILKKGVYRAASFSPNGKFILFYETLKPYSLSLPLYRFGYKIFITDNEGELIEELVKKPVQDQIPVWGTEVGMRYPMWSQNGEATIIWAEAQDGGDPKAKVEYRDFLFYRDFENDKPKTLFYKMKERFGDVNFFKEEGEIIISEYDYDKEWSKKFILNYLDNSIKPKLIEDRSEKDKYNDPGKIITYTDDENRELIFEDDGYIYYRGSGYTKEGKFPFLDRVKKSSWKKERVFQSNKDEYARFVEFYNGDRDKFIILTESKKTPPNYYIYDKDSKNRVKVSENEDPTPELREIKKEVIVYEREDSLKLSGTLYYPSNYEEGKKYPLLIWAYPREYRDAKVASQISATDNRFTRVWGASQIYLALEGYMVLDNASMPVIGDVIERNNTFHKQIVMNAKAAIDYLSDKGLIDREKVAVAGHSYGAFMTANLLAHSNLFKAGIARSGAYNRTLTPFGFQSERRTYWEAKDFYNKVSPFMNAEKIKTPLLLIHGQNDPNPGTFPIQSERLYDAIKGNGGIVRLVTLPYEGHGYSARESGLHVLREMIDWLDRYLKDKK
ncbi:MAG: prolyl oligopeptidase [Candidatus Delongbacteria bacterium]|nr:MAG: prolyl oligopeptidase [Candidatus Delongbacteria bacterium]